MLISKFGSVIGIDLMYSWSDFDCFSLDSFASCILPVKILKPVYLFSSSVQLVNKLKGRIKSFKI